MKTLLNIIWLVFSGIWLAFLYAVAGLIMSLALGHALSSWLYGITASDPATFAVVVLLLSFTAFYG